MDSRFVEHRAAWIESLFLTGETNLVLCRLSGFFSVDGLRCDLSSDCVQVTVWEWWNSSDGEREGRVSEGKAHVRCEEGWFEGFVDRFLIGWGDVVMFLSGVFLWLFLNGGLLGFFLSRGDWLFLLGLLRLGLGVIFVTEGQIFLALPSPLSFLFFKFWVSSMGTSLLVWVFLGLRETIFFGAGEGVFCVACGNGDEGVFWITLEGSVVLLFLVTNEDIGTVSLGTGVFGFGSLSVFSAFDGVSPFILLRVTWVHPFSVLGGFSASQATLVTSLPVSLGRCVVSASLRLSGSSF